MEMEGSGSVIHDETVARLSWIGFCFFFFFLVQGLLIFIFSLPTLIDGGLCDGDERGGGGGGRVQTCLSVRCEISHSVWQTAVCIGVCVCALMQCVHGCMCVGVRL